MRRLLGEAINTVRSGGTPAGVAPSYYDLLLRTAGIAARRRLASNLRARNRTGEYTADGVRDALLIRAAELTTASSTTSPAASTPRCCPVVGRKVGRMSRSTRPTTM